MTGILSIQRYLSGKVRNIPIPDDAVASILIDAHVTQIALSDVDGGDTSSLMFTPVTKDTDVSLLTERERELCVAWLYVWMSNSPSQTGSRTDEDADWSHTDGGERMSDKKLDRYLDMANAIFSKYDLPTVGEEDWGFVGRGICNPRNYRPRQ